MNTAFYFIVGLIVGGIIGWFLRPKNDADKNENVKLSALLSQQKTEIEHMRTENKSLVARAAASEEKIKTLENVRGEMMRDFKNVSAELLNENRKLAVAESKTTLEPFAKQLTDTNKTFLEQITNLGKSGAENKASLEKYLEILGAQTTNLQREARDLTDALRGQAKLQGNWSEMQITKILELNGLESPRDYTEQEYFHDDEHRRFTDFVIKLPDDRNIIIDSKNTLRSYYDYVRADDAADKKAHMDAYVRETKNRITELSGKAYQDLVGGRKLDFVFMFVPLEHAYLAALSAAPDLYEFAFAKNVVLVTPSLLVPMIRMVANLWNIDKQNKNVEKIVGGLKNLYEKYAGFVDDYATLGRQMDTMQKTYLAGTTKLSGRGGLSSRFENMRVVGGLPVNKKLAITSAEDSGDDTDE